MLFILSDLYFMCIFFVFFSCFQFQSCSRDETNTLNKSSGEFEIRLKPISPSTSTNSGGSDASSGRAVAERSNARAERTKRNGMRDDVVGDDESS